MKYIIKTNVAGFFWLFLNVSTRKFKITYVPHICGSHYTSIEQCWFRGYVEKGRQQISIKHPVGAGHFFIYFI